jgi:DNA transformation protein
VAAGCGPFEYQRGGKTVALGYWQVPADVLDEPEALCAWARRACAAAQRAKTAGR